jgi:hypothetical protein
VGNVPEIKMELPEGKDLPWVDKQFQFNGAWIPDVDPSLIGPGNFATLNNFRYNDASIEGVNGYARINTSAITTYIKLRNGHQLRTNRTTKSNVLVHAADDSNPSRVYLNTGTIDTASNFNTTYKLDTSGNSFRADASAGLEGRFSDAPQQSVCYCNGEESVIFSGDEQRIAAAFLVSDVPSLTDPQDPKDVTSEINNSLSTTGNTAIFDATWDKMLIMTTRPIQGLKAYITGTTTDVNGVLTVKTWTGAGFGADLLGTDSTITAGQSFSTTGTITLSAHTNGTSVLMHYQELYLFAYLLEWDQTIDATVFQVTVDMAMQEVQNVWDGVYRQPIQFQVSTTGASYNDYTLHVNQSSDISAPVGAELDSLQSGGNIIVMFEERMAGIRFTMAADKLNTASQVIATVKYLGRVLLNLDWCLGRHPQQLPSKHKLYLDLLVTRMKLK